MSINESALPQADPGASPTPSAPADATASPAVSPGRDGASPAPSPESPNIRQLREQYEHLKGQYEPWQKLNARPEEVSQQIALLGKMRSEAQHLAQTLGYDVKEVESYFQKDAVQVLAFLRQQANQAQSQPQTPDQIQRQMQRMIEQQTKPVMEYHEQRMNEEAESRFTVEFDRLFKEKFKEGLPDENREAIMELVGQMVGDDPQAIQRLKFERKTSDVQKYFETAVNRYLKLVANHSSHERKRIGGEPSPTNGQPLEKPKSKLDQKVAGGVTIRELMNM